MTKKQLNSQTENLLLDHRLNNILDIVNQLKKQFSDFESKINDIAVKVDHIDSKAENMIGLMQNYIEDNMIIVKRVERLENAIKPKIVNGANK